MLSSSCRLRGLEFALREVLVLIVDRLELAAINGGYGLRKQVHIAAQLNELPTDRPNRFAVMLAKIGNRLAIRH